LLVQPDRWRRIVVNALIKFPWRIMLAKIRKK